ncbi:hypothetical protein CC2G_008251 [Coprinopsis cinerea AmutBmut pab1-1]|nr:hypothetical protein CC2G_008251 [Coprinopsis cinerea AmutBmut pab1-1]
MKAAGETGGAFTLVENIYGCVLGLMQEVLQPTLRDTSNPVSTQIAAPPPRSSAGTRAESAQVPNSSSRLSAMITPITVAANTRLDTRTTSPEWLIQGSFDIGNDHPSELAGAGPTHEVGSRHGHRADRRLSSLPRDEDSTRATFCSTPVADSMWFSSPPITCYPKPASFEEGKEPRVRATAPEEAQHYPPPKDARVYHTIREPLLQAFHPHFTCDRPSSDGRERGRSHCEGNTGAGGTHREGERGGGSRTAKDKEAEERLAREKQAEEERVARQKQLALAKEKEKEAKRLEKEKEKEAKRLEKEKEKEARRLEKEKEKEARRLEKQKENTKDLKGKNKLPPGGDDDDDEYLPSPRKNNKEHPSPSQSLTWSLQVNGKSLLLRDESSDEEGESDPWEEVDPVHARLLIKAVTRKFPDIADQVHQTKKKLEATRAISEKLASSVASQRVRRSSTIPSMPIGSSPRSGTSQGLRSGHHPTQEEVCQRGSLADLSEVETDSDNETEKSQRGRPTNYLYAVKTREWQTFIETCLWHESNAPSLQNSNDIKRITGASISREDDVHIYSADGLQTHTFRPTAHEDLHLFFHLWDRVRDSYVDQRPLHVVKPELSAFRVISSDEYERIGEQGRVKLYSRVAPSSLHMPRPHNAYGSYRMPNRWPLSRTPSEEVTLQDFTLPIGPTRMVTSPLRRIIEESLKPLHQRRILNALSHRVVGCHQIIEGRVGYGQIPNGATNWSIAATAGASHALHMDADGASTRVVCRSGAKVWINFTPCAEGLRSQCRRQDYFDLDVYEPSLPGWRAEAIYLEPGMEILQPPGMLHAVYTIEDSVCDGQHFFNVRTLVQTFLSMVICFCSDRYVTNSDHPEFLMVLHRMLLFQYRHHVDKVPLPEYEQHILDPTCIPDAENLIALLVIAMTSELFHPDTYTEDGMTAQDLYYASTIRGAAWKLVQVLNDSYEFSWKLGHDAVVTLLPFKDVFRHVLGVQMSIISLMHEKIKDGFEAEYDSDEIWAMRTLHYELVLAVPVQPRHPIEPLDHWQLMRKGATPSLISMLEGMG